MIIKIIESGASLWKKVGSNCIGNYWKSPFGRRRRLNAILYGQLDHKAILKMRDEYRLMMCGIKLFIVPMASKRFALYLAEREEEARAKHHKMYGVLALTVLDVSDKMDTETFCEDTKKWQSFRDLKRQVLQFPYYVGEMSGRDVGR